MQREVCREVKEYHSDNNGNDEYRTQTIICTDICRKLSRACCCGPCFILYLLGQIGDNTQKCREHLTEMKMDSPTSNTCSCQVSQQNDGQFL